MDLQTPKKLLPGRQEKIEAWFRSRNNKWASADQIAEAHGLKIDVCRYVLQSFRGAYESKRISKKGDKVYRLSGE